MYTTTPTPHIHRHRRAGPQDETKDTKEEKMTQPANIFGTTNLNPRRPYSPDGAANTAYELMIEQFSGLVHNTIARRSLFTNFVTPLVPDSTGVVSNRAMGATNVMVMIPGQANNAQAHIPTIRKKSLTIDTVLMARTVQFILDKIQQDYNMLAHVAVEHGHRLTNIYDQAFFIQAIKGAKESTFAYGNMSGYGGGSTVTTAKKLSELTPQELYEEISKLVADFLKKDIMANQDDIMLVLHPDAFIKLQMSQFVANGNYVTSAGLELNTRFLFHVFGIPVATTNNCPWGVAKTTSLLESTSQGGPSTDSNYEVDASKVYGVLMGPRGFLAGKAIDMKNKLFHHDLSHSDFLDTWMSFGVTYDDNQYLGVLEAAEVPTTGIIDKINNPDNLGKK